MKKIFSFSAIILFCLFISLQPTLSSCTKDKTIYDTVTVIKRDTIVQIKVDTLKITDTTVTAQILTAHPWKLQEIRGVKNNSAYYYLRGGNSNTDNFDNEYIIFNANKTGSYFDNNGGQSSLTWDFIGQDNSKIIYTVNFPSVVTTINWENLRFKNGAIKYDEYYSQNGFNSHSQASRIAK